MLDAPLTRLMLVFLVACGPGRTTFARYPGAAPAFNRNASDPKALAIADKVLAAAGGADKWNAAKQVRWSESVVHDGKEVIAGEQAWDRWNGRHHGRMRREGGDMVVMRPIYEDGGTAFVDNGQSLRKIENGTTETVAAARERWQFDTAVLCMPFLLQEPGTKLEYVGEVAGDDGKPLDAIKVTFDPKDTTRTSTYQVSVNRETNLIERIEIRKAEKPDERLGYHLKDWVDSSGLKFASVFENIGYSGEVITFKDIKVSDPDDTLYVPPVR